MNSDGQKRNLGRGLSALLGRRAAASRARRRRARCARCRSSRSHPGAFQPRQRFEQEELEALAEFDPARTASCSRSWCGRAQAHAGSFEIVAGERRWRAAQLAKLHEVPIILKRAQRPRSAGARHRRKHPARESDRRWKRPRLSPADRRIRQHPGRPLASMSARAAATSPTRCACWTCRMPCVLLDDGKLSAGHARALIGTADPSALAALVVNRGLNVRQTEKLAKFGRSKLTPRPRVEKDADTRALERDLTARLGLHVAISGQGESGHVTIQYKTLEQLDLVDRPLAGRDRQLSPRATNPPGHLRDVQDRAPDDGLDRPAGALALHLRLQQPLESGGDRWRPPALGLGLELRHPLKEHRRPQARISRPRHRRRRSPAAAGENAGSAPAAAESDSRLPPDTRSMTLSRSDSLPIPAVNTRSSSVVSEESPMQASASASVTGRISAPAAGPM